MQQITATAASQTLVAANRAQYDLLRAGVQATFHNDKGERVRQRLKVFDFETPRTTTFSACVSCGCEATSIAGEPTSWALSTACLCCSSSARISTAISRPDQDLDQEESRAAREGLDEESLAIFDLLQKPNLSAPERERIKQVAIELLRTLKAGKLRVSQWRDKEATRDAVRVAIHNFLWSDEIGLPSDDYSEAEVGTKTDDVFRHVFRTYPTVPSPYYEDAA